MTAPILKVLLTKYRIQLVAAVAILYPIIFVSIVVLIRPLHDFIQEHTRSSKIGFSIFVLLHYAPTVVSFFSLPFPSRMQLILIASILSAVYIVGMFPVYLLLHLMLTCAYGYGCDVP